MKKIIAICALLTAATSVFCETTQKETADVYEVEEQKQEEKKLSKRKQREEERKRREAPVELASSSVFRYNGFETDVKQDNTVIFYYPATKEIGFTAESTGELVLSFGKVAQETIKVAFNEYKDKFEKKELSTKKNKTSRIFGNTKCRYIYDTFFKDTKAEPTVRLGYVFVKKSPYFMLTVEESKTTIRNPVDPERDPKTKKLKILFNKNQMQALIDQFDYQPNTTPKTEITAETKTEKQQMETATTE